MHTSLNQISAASGNPPSESRLQRFGINANSAAATIYMARSTTALWFDADGAGAGSAGVVAFLAGSPLLTASNIVFI